MHGKKNNLIVIENGQISTYCLDDKLVWELGRPSKDNLPDIRLHSATVSRRHGKFQNMDGIWFYVDYKGKNGTVYNDKHITAGLNGRIKPIILKDRDVFVFGGGEKAIVSCKTIWAMFSQNDFIDDWKTEDAKGLSKISFLNGEERMTFVTPVKGTVFESETGMAIYMGSITYLIGNIMITRNE